MVIFTPTIRRLHVKRFLLFSIFTLLTLQSFAAERAVDSGQVNIPSEKILVSSVKGADWRSYRTMLKCVDTFNMLKSLAPNADLRFELRPQEDSASTKDVVLKLVNDAQSVLVPIANDGTFILKKGQISDDTDADLSINKKRGLFRWLPYVRSPGLPTYTRRLGDLRLECEVLWAIEKGDASFAERSFFALLGGRCSSSKVRWFFRAPGEIEKLEFSFGDRKEIASENSITKDRLAYYAPLYDKTWPDDTLILFSLKSSQ
jgi:hypothetical protein